MEDGFRPRREGRVGTRPSLRLPLLVAAGVGLAACGLSPTMERARPVSSHCPDESLPRALQGPPDTVALRWYRAADDRDRKLAASWCGTVGTDVVRLRPAQSFMPWRGEGPLTLLSWNMELGGGDLLAFLQAEAGLSCGDGGPASPSRVNPFVLMLQEAWRFGEDLPRVEGGANVPWTVDPDRETGSSLDVVDVADRCRLALVYVPSARNGPDDDARPGEDKGNAILSSVPLSTPIALDLPLEGGRKVAVGATFYAPGGERVRAVSTHLDVASTLFRTLTSGNQTRVRQALGLVDGLDKAERDGPLTGVTVVGADMNTWVGNESALKIMWREFPESPPWDGGGTWERLSFPADHMFFRHGPFQNLTVEGYRLLEERYGSDHHARGLTLTWVSAVERDRSGPQSSSGR